MTESRPLSRPIDYSWEERIRQIQRIRTVSHQRIELPWPIITLSVITAIDDHYRGKKFINIKYLAEYISTSSVQYPMLTGESYNAIKARIWRVLDKNLKWKRYTANGSRASIFVDGRVSE